MGKDCNEIYTNLSKKYGTPLYIYNLLKITSACERLRDALPQDSKLLYSVKCNNNETVIKHLASLNFGFEIANIDEYKLLIKAGISPTEFMYTAPSKTADDIRYVVENGISIISCESLEEFETIYLVGLILRKKINVILRLNLSKPQLSSSLKMAGVSSQFGIDYEKFINNSQYYLNGPLKICGIHTFFGSNIVNLQDIVSNVKEIVDISNSIEQKFGVELKIINFGGGFSAPYASNDKYVELFSIKNQLEKEFQKINKRDEKQLFFESGRYLLAESGTLIGKIIYRKISKGEHFLISDVGMHCLNGLSSSLKILRPKNEMNFLQNREGKLKYTVVGPSCSPLDVIRKDIMLNNEVESGDIFYINNVGAYGLSASLNNFLSRSLPLELCTINRKVVSVTETTVKKNEIDL